MLEYHKSFRKTIIAFLNIFNEIYVQKYNSAGEVDRTVKVPIKFAPKEKFYLWIYDRNHAKKLPMISTEISNIEYDETRKTGKHENVTISVGEDQIEYYKIPSPYNIGFELKIATEYLNEMEQIVSQFLPFFDPFVYTTIDMPEFDDRWNIAISFQSMSLDSETSYGKEEKRKIIWTFDFVARTYMTRPKSNIKTIKNIITNWYADQSAWDSRSTETQTMSGDEYSVRTDVYKGFIDEESKILYDYEVFEE